MIANFVSVIRHTKQPLVILRTDYLLISEGNHCAAKLLSILENWTNWFISKGKFGQWVKLPGEKLINHLLGEHNIKQIRSAISLLVSKNFIRQEKRRAYKYDQSWFYWLDIERVQLAIDAVMPFAEPETEDDFTKIEAVLEAETPVVIESAKSAPSRELVLPARSGEIVPIEAALSPDDHNRNSNRNLNKNNNNECVLKLELPSAEQLKRNRVDIYDECLQKISLEFPERINDAVAAWLEWAGSGNISAPTRSLIKAIKEGWKPEKQTALKEINPPSDEQKQRLEELKRDRHIESIMEQPSGNGWITVVSCGDGLVVPWWEFLIQV